jgi:hypothetical protein
MRRRKRQDLYLLVAWIVIVVVLVGLMVFFAGDNSSHCYQ